MLMPKAAVDKDHGPAARKDEIGRARQIPPMEPKPEPQTVRGPTYEHFRTGVLAPYPGH